jgi:hypothetical protein
MDVRSCVSALTPLLLIGVVGWAAVAAVPLTMNYQVMLTDDADQPLVDQPVDLVFRLYESERDGPARWSEEHSTTTNSIGVVSVVLGSVTPLVLEDFSVPLWLEVEVNDEILAPRRELASGPYALHAADSDLLGGAGPEAYSLEGHEHDAEYVNEGQADAVTADMVVPDVVSSVDGVSNDGGDIDLVAGSNVSIVPDDVANTITISATGGDDGDWTSSGDDIYRSTGNVSIGTSQTLARLLVAGDDADYGSVVHFVGDLTTSSSRVLGLKLQGDPSFKDFMACLDPDGATRFEIGGDGNVSMSGTAEMTGFTMPTGASDGHVLTSDAGGGASWQPLPVTEDNDWTLDGSDVYRTTGNVGIGTSSPTEELHMSGHSLGLAMDATNEGEAKILFRDHETPETERIELVFDSDSQNLYMRSDDDPFGSILTVQHAGMVGVGTTMPMEDLHVAGTARVDGFTMPTGANSGHVLTSDGSGNATWQAPAAADDGDWTTAGDDIYRLPGRVGIGTSSPDARLEVNNYNIRVSGHGITYPQVELHNPDTYDWSVRGGNDFRIRMSGDNGATWDDRLLINYFGDVTIPGNGDLDVGGPLTAAMGASVFGQLLVDGAVGIGTSSPNTTLDVHGQTIRITSMSPDIELLSPGFGSWGIANTSLNLGFFYSDDDLATSTLYAHFLPAGDFQLLEGDLHVPNGSVGVGTSSPSTTLHVEGKTTCANPGDGDGCALEVTGPVTGNLINVFSTDTESSSNLLVLNAGVSPASSAHYLHCGYPTPGFDSDFRLSLDQNGYADGSWNGGGADLAEMMVSSRGADALEPGDVLVIDTSSRMAVSRSDEARSRLVAGVYSTKPGFVCSEREWDEPDPSAPDGVLLHDLESRASDYGEVPVAVVGIVPCKVSAENGPIQVGDLLVSSDTPGHAMRDQNPGPGTVIGKALEPHQSGRGTIRILVTLQ